MLPRRSHALERSCKTFRGIFPRTPHTIEDHHPHITLIRKIITSMITLRRKSIIIIMVFIMIIIIVVVVAFVYCFFLLGGVRKQMVVRVLPGACFDMPGPLPGTGPQIRPGKSENLKP